MHQAPARPPASPQRSRTARPLPATAINHVCRHGIGITELARLTRRTTSPAHLQKRNTPRHNHGACRKPRAR